MTPLLSSVRSNPGFTPCRRGFPTPSVTPTVSVGRQGLSIPVNKTELVYSDAPDARLFFTPAPTVKAIQSGSTIRKVKV